MKTQDQLRKARLKYSPMNALDHLTTDQKNTMVAELCAELEIAFEGKPAAIVLFTLAAMTAKAIEQRAEGVSEDRAISSFEHLVRAHLPKG